MRTLKTKTSRAYDKRLKLQVRKADQWSGHLKWTDVPGDFWAAIRSRTATLPVEGQQEQEITKYEVFTPWRPGVFLTQAERRFVDDQGRHFYIASAVDINEEHREFQVTCTLDKTE